MKADSFLIGPRRRQGGLALATLFLLFLLGGLVWPRPVFSAYWYGLMFWTELSLGCLIVALLQYLTGGRWGRVGFPLLQTGMRGLFFLVPLYLPAFFTLPLIFPWAAPGPMETARLWLNPAAFILRTILYLAALARIAIQVCRWQPPGVLQGPDAARTWSGPLLVATVVLLSLASADWMMSLQRDFYSSLYPFLYFGGAMVVVFSLLSACAAFLQRRGLWPEDPGLRHDYGKLLFAAVLFWGYLTFSQFIIVWNGNLPREAAWYVARTSGGWFPFTMGVLLLHFAVPFCLLLSRRLKRDSRRLLVVAGGLFGVHFAEVCWMTAPRLGHGFHLDPFAFLAPILIGAWWAWGIAPFVPRAVEDGRAALSLLPEPAHE